MGLGVSGRSAVDFLVARGARVVAADERPAERIPELGTLPATVEARLGRPFEGLDRFDLVVPSPGVPRARWAGEARRAWGDIELCYRALPIPIVAVTGTNGKSTVVKLIEAMARAAGLRARAAGNLGVPALSLVGEALDLAILEVSSFQLEAVEDFRPRTGLLLNLSPDHLDRHGDLAGYHAAKARLFARQGEGDHAILNGDDPLAASTPLPPGVERLEFRRQGPVEAGAWLDGERAIVRRGGRTTSASLALETLGASGAALAPQRDNLLASLLALATLDLDLAAATRALASFEGLPHRCQSVAHRGDVHWIDDSKATNVGAAARSLESLPGPIVWIAGGRHKGGALAPLAESARGRVRAALLIGEAAPQLALALGEHVPHEPVPTLEEAVARADALARPGDTVLLAPACASFDQFQDFADRGRRFQAAVAALGTTPPATRAADPSARHHPLEDCA